METYTETIYRYVVESMDINMSEERRAEYRINGIDPDDNWRLAWSFLNEKDAVAQMEKDENRHKEFCKDYGCDVNTAFRVRDLGETKYVERKVGWF